MQKELILEKINQAAKILNEKNIDMWMTYVRETGNMRDPMLDMIVGANATWQSAFIITKNGDTHAIIGSLELENMKSVGTYKNIHPYLKTIKEKFPDVIESIKPNKIALNYSVNSSLADGLTHGLYLDLLEQFKETDYPKKFVSSEDIVAALRGRKSPSEIKLIKEAIAETLKIFDEVTKFLKPGITEKQVAAFVQNLVKERGFELAWDGEYCPSVFTGPDTAGAHSGPTDRAIEPGHIINMDFGIKINGYCSDLQRTWYVLKPGEDNPPEEVTRGFNVIVESITKAARELKPGKEGWEIDQIARNYIQINGYDEFPHGLGHQVGRAVHDGGALLGPKWERYGNLPTLKIEAGNVFTIEPRLTVDKYGIATVEEMVLVNSDGCEFLSERQKELLIIKS
ncbi:peptidase M24 [Melioribacter roseus P3M-2]|uniref:Peptidase M24 n=1 Tax=Melioribacter roseus (strain DSM 23840 / JCM 17771 / VKM B-2668 / P3M-2) TaxID=1191523 RepID=I6ZPK1_MELRP|nr:Xaa-Pro peptidase family protein [Melioribacter roseus]AFN73949.1 peptidase M24 [Melioribacter roseus P3M-2]